MYKLVNFNSGFSVSIQASLRNYCTPRSDTGPYTAVELGFPNSPEPLIIGYAEDVDDPTGTIYAWVPAGVVGALLIKHGGIESGTLPDLNMNTNQSAILAEALLEIENESR